MTDFMGACLFFAASYVVGYGHGAWMAYTTPVRFRRWAEGVCANGYESVMATYEKGSPK